MFWSIFKRNMYMKEKMQVQVFIYMVWLINIRWRFLSTRYTANDFGEIQFFFSVPYILKIYGNIRRAVYFDTCLFLKNDVFFDFNIIFKK